MKDVRDGLVERVIDHNEEMPGERIFLGIGHTEIRN
jgi:hypothetical protein